MQVLAVSLSYLIYDLACCHFGERVSLDNTVHHLVSIVGIVAGLSYQKVIISSKFGIILFSQYQSIFFPYCINVRINVCAI